MRYFNLLWIATVQARLQIRFALWSYDKLVALGLALRNLRKYHKFDPEVEDMIPYYRKPWYDSVKLDLGDETFDEYLDRMDKIMEGNYGS